MPVEQASFEELRKNHRGQVIAPGDDAYDSARRVWNAMIDKRPAVIVRPRSAVDVIAAVKFGKDEGLPIAIRGGAHSVAGSGTCDAGIVIDFSEMKGIHVDPKGRTVRAEPGLQMGRVRSRDTGVRPGDDRRHRRRHRNRRPDARRRIRLARRHARHDRGQRALGGSRARQRRARARERVGESRPLLGDPRRRRQLRRGDVVHLSAASRRADDRRRDGRPSVQCRGRRACASSPSSSPARPIS